MDSSSRCRPAQNGKKRKKNRPQEVSSKAPPKVNMNNKVDKGVDPRFDSLYGEYNEHQFRTSYDFIEKIKKKEKRTLLQLLKKESDPEEKVRIKYLLTRAKNQEREMKMRTMRENKILEEKRKYAEAVFEGKRPIFPRKEEKVTEELLENFDRLNSKGRLVKYLKKKHKKISKKESELF